MAKNLLQDMVRRKTVREQKVPPPAGVPEPVKVVPARVEAREPVKIPASPSLGRPELVKTPPLINYEPKYSAFETKFASINDVGDQGIHEGRSRYALWIVAATSAMFLVFALSYLFSSAKVTINPKVKDSTLDVSLSAVKDGAPSDLPFELVVLSGEENKTVVAGTEKDVSIKSKGRVIIYNAFGASPQALAIDTRLEGSNGKMYKTETKLTVPGMKGNTPGSIEVSIYAVEAGVEYNSAPLDFKIFGFKGTPKYAKFYARSKGDITGGLVGKSSDISETDKIKLVLELKNALQAKLLSKAIEQIPDGFILFKGGSLLNTNGDNLKITPGTDNKAVASLEGTFSGFLFDEKTLTTKIAEKVLPSEDANKIYIKNIRDLTFTLSNKDNLGADIKNINFDISGNAKIVWKVDEQKLTDDILGQPKKNFNTILSSYANVDSAQLVIRPFWKTSLPKEVDDIKIIVKYPK